ncbi:MAG TPA: hypothetical protein VFV94_20255 [Polyangiaceae bacterium]|nr:hypothetical protein [Polyangiaceae bacterium]
MDKEQAPAPAPPPAAESEAGLSSAKDEDRASSIEAAIAEFDRARMELSGLIGREIGGAQAAATAPAAGAAPTPAAPEPARAQEAAPSKPSSRAAPRDDKATAEKKSENGCVNVCRALDSLTRSAAAVCRLDEGDRCKKASSVVTSAQGDPSVKACGCKR